MAAVKPIVIEVALNGSRPRSEHAAIPVTPNEVALDAAKCFEAGAHVAHIHARDVEGRWNIDPGWYADAIRGIKSMVDKMQVSITTIRPAGVPVDAVVEAIEALAADPGTRPDLVSVNLGHIADWNLAEGRTTHFSNDYTEVSRLLKTCARLHIKPELGVMDFGFISNAVMVRNAGLLSANPWFLLELDSPGYGVGPQVAPATVENYDALTTALRSQFPDAQWAAHGHGAATFAVLQRAIETGAHIRVGFEDSIILADRRPSGSNAEQVSWAFTTAIEFGRVPATLDEARQIVGCRRDRSF